MSPDEKIFSEEYVSNTGTQLPSPPEPPSPEYKDETEASPKMYGSAKPKRRIIRGRIIHD